jgi:HIRAN domain-containing protein
VPGFQVLDHLTEIITVTVWLLGATLIGAAARGRGRNGFAWFTIGILISPLLALLLFVAVGEPKPKQVSSLLSAGRLSRARRAVILGDGEFRFPIVGESHYQLEIEAIAGGRSEDGARNILVDAVLIPEPNNPYDPNAVAVKIDNETVGYLSRDTAKHFCRALVAGGFEIVSCEAVINGGWDRGEGDRGHFGVRLNAALPFRLQVAAD